MNYNINQIQNKWLAISQTDKQTQPGPYNFRPGAREIFYKNMYLFVNCIELIKAHRVGTTTFRVTFFPGMVFFWLCRPVLQIIVWYCHCLFKNYISQKSIQQQQFNRHYCFFRQKLHTLHAHRHTHTQMKTGSTAHLNNSLCDGSCVCIW